MSARSRPLSCLPLRARPVPATEAPSSRQTSITEGEANGDDRLSSPLPSALHAAWPGPEVGIAMSQSANPGKADFYATLLAMAGHDLRQPLQMITSAHD